eukprot:702901-Pleurochrysis_carterae.AAC.1
MQYLVNLHSSRKPGTSSAICYRNRNGKTSTSYNKLPPHRGQLLHRNKSARDRQPHKRAPKGAGKRRTGRAREHARRAINDTRNGHPCAVPC